MSAPVLGLLCLLLLLKLGLCKEFNLILLCLETEDFHLHHLHLEALGLLNVYARSEWQGRGIYLRGGALLVGEPGAVYTRSERTLVNSVGNVDVLRFSVVVRFLITRLRGETGEGEGCTRGSGVRDVGGGTNAAGAKTSKEGSTVVLLRYGHLGGSEGRERSI